jgi:hypothetical protein
MLDEQQGSMQVRIPGSLLGAELVSPVVLYAPQRAPRDFEDQIHLSQGTCLAATIDPNAPHYVDDARAPAPYWRPGTQVERSILWSDEAPPTHRGVGVARLLGPLLVQLFARRRDIFDRPDDSDTLKHPLVGLLLDIIQKAGLITKHIYSARIGSDSPGLITMTRAVDRDARIGLHFDRWDGLSVDELESSSNRISINLGPSDRYFIFLNQTASGMAAILEREGLRVARDVRAIGLAFMSAFPDYPIVRIRLRPGDAYIAPTENILHDGTSFEVAEENHYLSLRGRFNFLPV